MRQKTSFASTNGLMRPETSFAIVGAGPAGMVAAKALKDRGYADITIFEKEDVVGGKCRSFTYGGRPHDLGANLTTARYDSIRTLASDLGLTSRTVAERRIVNVGTELAETLGDASTVERLALRAGAQLYYLFRHLAGVEKPGYVLLPDSAREPFRNWLRKRMLGRFIELFEVLFVAYGYGAVMDLPAAYALKFFDKVHLDAAINTVLGKGVPDTTEFVEGFQELWVRLAREYSLDVVLEAQITSITRRPNGVTIEYLKSGLRRTEEFDKLILACPLLPSNLQFLDATAAERNLFSKVQTNQYFVTVARVSGLPQVSTYVYPYARQLTPGQPTVFYPPASAEPGVFTFYAYGGSGITTEQVQANIQTVVGQLEGKVEEFLHTQVWDYFPHVDTRSMRCGFYEKLDLMQGQWHTYYVGELLSFTLVELIHDHVDALIEHIVGREKL